MSDQFIIQILIIAFGAIFGGSATIFGMKFNFPGAKAIKRGVFNKRDWHELLSHLESPHVLTVIYQQRKEQFLADAELSFVSDSAMKFYGYQDRGALIGKNADELLETLSPWLANKTEFDKDQERVKHQLKEGKLAVAEEPMIINDQHPSPEFRGKRYHPVIAHWATDQRKDGIDEKFLTVLYLDLSVIPAPKMPRAQGQAA